MGRDGKWFAIKIRVNGSIIPNTLPTSDDKTVTTDEDVALTFTTDNFTFSDADTDDELDHVTITSLPAADTGTLSFDDTEITSVNPPQQVTPADLDASKLTYAPPDGRQRQRPRDVQIQGQ